MIVPILAALQLLTLAPPLVRRPFTAVEMGRAVGFFPLVGLLIGGALAGLDQSLALVFPPAVTTALVLVGWVLVTGALHLDGFLDTCDGLWGGGTPEARLRIMRDERVGAYAVIGAVLLLLVKFSALGAVSDRGAALVLAAVLGRWGMTMAIIVFPYARLEGLGRGLKDHAGLAQALLATVTTGAAAWFVGAVLAAIALLAVAVGTCLGGLFVMKRLPGLTGDVYGAMCEVLETLVLLVCVAGESSWA